MLSFAFSSSALCKSSPALSFTRCFRTVQKRKLPVPKYEKRLDVVIMGDPNAGKSVLLNRLVGTQLAATSRKRHTTRTEILGVFNHRNTQLAFYDTPGYVRKAEANKEDVKELCESTVKTAKKADVVMIVVDSARCEHIKYYDAFCEMVRIALDSSKKEIILVLNKVDLIKPKTKLLDITRTLVSYINGVKLGPGKEHLAKLDTTTFMVSALQNDGLIDIKNYLLAISDIKPWIVSSHQGVSPLRLEQRTEQVVLEKLLDMTHDEIPYAAEVRCTRIRPTDKLGKHLEVSVDIWVDTRFQRQVVIGRNARTLVQIRQRSVADLMKIMKTNVTLIATVRVRNKKGEIVEESSEGDYDDDDNEDDDEYHH